jgi:hypothetical protein
VSAVKATPVKLAMLIPMIANLHHAWMEVSAQIVSDPTNVHALMGGLENGANKKLPCARFNNLAKTTRPVLISSKTSSASAQVELMANNVKLLRKDVLATHACTMESVETLDPDWIVHAPKTTRELDVNMNLMLAKTTCVKMVLHA